MSVALDRIGRRRHPSGMRYAYALVIFAGLTSTAAAKDLPPPVAAAVAAAKDICKSRTSTLEPDFLKRQDVNGDGVPDFILNLGAVRCDGESAEACGAEGCAMQIFASSNGTFVEVFDMEVHELEFRNLDGRPAILIDNHGPKCGEAGEAPCGPTLYWNGTEFSRTR